MIIVFFFSFFFSLRNQAQKFPSLNKEVVGRSAVTKAVMVQNNIVQTRVAAGKVAISLESIRGGFPRRQTLRGHVYI